MRPFSISNKIISRQIGVYIPASLHKKVAEKCTAEQVPLSIVIREFLKGWVKGETTKKTR